MSLARPSPWAWILALLLPLVVLGGTWSLLQRPARDDVRSQLLERALRQVDELEVLVLGSSLARTNVDLDVLAESLGVPRRNVALLTLPNATAPHWYALYKNRVLAKGHRPRVVLLVGALTTMITPDVLMDTSVDRLVDQLTDDEPVIARKVFGTDDPGVFRWLYLRGQGWDLRDSWVQALRDHVLAAVFRVRGGATAAARLAERADELVFADEAMAYDLHQASGTGLAMGAVEALDLVGLDVARDSLVPDLASLASDHGATAVFVRTPFPPSNNDNDRVPADVEAAAERVFADVGALYVDLRALGLTDLDFRDMRHMSPTAATRFTRAIAARLRASGLFGRPRAGGEAYQPTSVEVSGATGIDLGAPVPVGRCAWRLGLPPTLAWRTEVPTDALGRRVPGPLAVTAGGTPVPERPGDAEACVPGLVWSEDALVVVGAEASAPPEVRLASPVADADGVTGWWVAPGATLTVRFDAPWPRAAAAFDVALRARRFGPGTGEVELAVAGVPVPVTRQGHVVYAHPQGEPPPGPVWDVTVRTPVDGPFVLVDLLRIGKAPFSVPVIGEPEALAGASIRLVGGRVDDTRAPAVFEGAPPTVVVDGPPDRLLRTLGALPVGNYRRLADGLSSREAAPHKCSPLRVVEDGVPLPLAHAVCSDVGQLRGGRTCHAGPTMFFASVDGSDPTSNGRAYGVVLDSARSCERRNVKGSTPLRGAVWLYPGDRATIAVPPAQATAFAQGANLLEIAVDPVDVPDGDTLVATLRHRGVPVASVSVPADAPPWVPRRAVLDPPLPPRAEGLDLVLENPGTGWWLVGLVTLSEAYGLGGEAPSVEVEAAIAEGADVLTSGPWTRVGAAPPLPVVRGLTALREGIVEGQLFPAWTVSASNLLKRGHGPWSPVELVDGERVLRPVAQRAALRDVADGFWHQGQSVVLRRGDARGALVARWSESLPLPVAGGEVVWIPAGTELTYRPGRLAPAGARLAVVADVLSGEKARDVVARLRVGEAEAPLAGEAPRLRAELPLPEGPIEAHVLAPGSGHVLLLSVELVTSSGAEVLWTAPSPPAGP